MNRIVVLDVARGVAILGTLATNIWIFSHPGGMLGYVASPTTPGASAAQVTVEQVLQQVANGKFLGLLTVMFGIGLAIQVASAARRGRKWPGPYLWRAALLFVDGLVNYLLVIEFDVLMGYAVTGAVVAYILARRPRTQRVWLVVTATLHVLLISWVTWAVSTGYASVPTADPAGAGERPNPYADGSWWDLVLLRVDHAGAFRAEPVLIAFGSITLFLLGSQLHRAGLFDPSKYRLRRSMMVVGSVAFVLDLVLALVLVDQQWLPLTRWVIAPVASLGLLALIVTVAQHRVGWIGSRLAELGRVALSGYILQNLLASAIFYGWGLGLNTLAPQYRLGATVLAGIIISVVICGWAHLWLQRFERGPVEWLWARGYENLSRLGRGAEPASAASSAADVSIQAGSRTDVERAQRRTVETTGRQG